MIQFSLPRFARVIQNDALRIARPVLFTTIALFGLTLLIYLFRGNGVNGPAQSVYQILFGSYLIATGLLLTGSAFQDMHHPLDRYHCLMLPMSCFERLLSRYLLTGPLFVLYATLAYMLFDFVGNRLVLMYWEGRQPLFTPFTAQTKGLVISYLLVHVVMLIGAVCFRTQAFLRTILFLLATLLALVLVENVSERVFFPDLYSWTQFDSIKPLPVDWQLSFAVSWMNYAFAVGLYGWLFYVAYLCLRDHET